MDAQWSTPSSDRRPLDVRQDLARIFSASCRIASAMLTMSGLAESCRGESSVLLGQIENLGEVGLGCPSARSRLRVQGCSPTQRRASQDPSDRVVDGLEPRIVDHAEKRVIARLEEHQARHVGEQLAVLAEERRAGGVSAKRRGELGVDVTVEKQRGGRAVQAPAVRRAGCAGSRASRRLPRRTCACRM